LAFTLVVAVAAPAAAKNGAEARLLTQLPLHAKPGAVISINWTVDEPAANGKRVPFGASGMFVRLIGRGNASTTATAPQNGPPYSVRIRVPRGGIRNIEVGLHGWASTPTGTHPAPVLFPIANNPFSSKR
jgi:hypothetical protein